MTNMQTHKLGVEQTRSITEPLERRGLAVKVCASRYPEAWKWMLREEDETEQPDLVYVFVALQADGKPACHVAPSAVVAEQVKANHERWLRTPRRDGGPHDPANTIRVFFDPDGEYRLS